MLPSLRGARRATKQPTRCPGAAAVQCSAACRGPPWIATGRWRGPREDQVTALARGRGGVGQSLRRWAEMPAVSAKRMASSSGRPSGSTRSAGSIRV
jgi:hypothetical protein